MNKSFKLKKNWNIIETKEFINSLNSKDFEYIFPIMIDRLKFQLLQDSYDLYLNKNQVYSHFREVLIIHTEKKLEDIIPSIIDRLFWEVTEYFLNFSIYVSKEYHPAYNIVLQIYSFVYNANFWFQFYKELKETFFSDSFLIPLKLSLENKILTYIENYDFNLEYWKCKFYSEQNNEDNLELFFFKFYSIEGNLFRENLEILLDLIIFDFFMYQSYAKKFEIADALYPIIENYFYFNLLRRFFILFGLIKY